MMGSDEQKEQWLEKVRKLEMIGCYVQSEIGHGSNVAGLETTATFDKASDCFIIHTPTLTATKAWGGAVGLWANFACIFATLVIDGKQYGMQGFVTQIRDLETHETLPGIKCGDLGPKLGQTSNDNGWMILNQV